jgi:uncharacterized protein
LNLLKDSGCDDRLIKHVKAVSRYAVEIAKSRGDADVELVRIGALLHDIGRCRSNGVDHGVAGGKILRNSGVDERIARIAEKHVGAGITAREAAELHFPPGHYMPQTLEEKIVAAVDNLMEGTRRVTVEKAEARFMAKLEGHPAAKRVRRLHNEIFDKASSRML